jgi:hypothetical protein
MAVLRADIDRAVLKSVVRQNDDDMPTLTEMSTRRPILLAKWE